mmetsp:Transcript_22759/g.49862  ORF Transcript_22759/g.49862 Transcript_22759/m.49862 type:complete len:170 (-) Transcript_22759:16-525(-)
MHLAFETSSPAPASLFTVAKDATGPGSHRVLCGGNNLSASGWHRIRTSCSSAAIVSLMQLIRIILGELLPGSMVNVGYHARRSEGWRSDDDSGWPCGSDGDTGCEYLRGHSPSPDVVGTANRRSYRRCKRVPHLAQYRGCGTGGDTSSAGSGIGACGTAGFSGIDGQRE